MRIQVRLFAAARQRLGRETIEVLLPTGATLAELRGAIARSQPDLSDLIPHVVFAIDAEYASDEAPLSESAEIACIPPVSGG